MIRGSVFRLVLNLKKTQKNNNFQVELSCTAVHAINMFRSDFSVVSGQCCQNSVTHLASHLSGAFCGHLAMH